MPLPLYSDLGKKAQDVFSKGYHFGLMKLELKSKTPPGLEFTSGGTSNTETERIIGNLETKYNFKDHGLTFTGKWDTSNKLCTALDIQDRIINGLKISLASAASPQIGVHNHVLKTEYIQDNITLHADVDSNHGSPLVNASTTIGNLGWVCGYQVSYDSSQSKVTKNNLAIGYSTDDFVALATIQDGQVLSGSVYHKVNPQLETGIRVGWPVLMNQTTFGLSCKYELDKNTSLGAKVNNFSQVGLSYQHKLHEGVTLTLSTLFDTMTVQHQRVLMTGAHKVGVSLEFEA